MAGLSTTDITKILRDPQSASGIDAAKIAALKDTYPYFITGQYLSALQQHLQEPYAPPVLDKLQLYKGNWLLLHQWLDKAIAKEPVTEPVKSPTATEPLPAPAAIAQEPVPTTQEKPLITPIFTEDYFLHQGMEVSNELPVVEEQKKTQEQEEEDKSLMVVMSFSEWLAYFKTKSKKEKEEEADQRALRTMWQKEKLAAALGEENDIIPENVFEMAVNSITSEDGLASESLAEIYVKQGKYDKAIDMYRKLSLRNPQKNAYFARQIETILKEQQS